MTPERMAITVAAAVPGRSLEIDAKDDLAQRSHAGTLTGGPARRVRMHLAVSQATGTWHRR
eukprot:15066001-Alexandrium_andersonii.AAC.1